jgi:NDP-mannose synthase
MSRKAVILAGGLGTRLKPFTDVMPKPLLPIGEKAVLEIQIENLKKHGVDEVFLATNYKSDYIENFFGDGARYGVKLHISREEKPLGTVGPVKLLKDHLSDNFIVMNGDILSSIDYSKFFDFANSMDCVLNVSVKKMVTPFAFGNITFDGDYVLDIQEKPDIVTYILAGIYIMSPKVFDIIPDDEYFGMDTLIKNMIASKMKIAKYELEEYWLDIGRVDDYQKAQNEYMKHFN